MANELYDELISKGYLPELKFRNDNYTKLLYVKNLSQNDVRISKKGQFNLPLVSLDNQNETMKNIAGGTRVHLGYTANSDGWVCAGIPTTTANVLDGPDETLRNFTITFNDGQSTDIFEVSGVYHFSYMVDDNPELLQYLIDNKIEFQVLSALHLSFVNRNDSKQFQVEIKLNTSGTPIGGVLGQENTSVVQVDDKTLRFCLANSNCTATDVEWAPTGLSVPNVTQTVNMLITTFWGGDEFVSTRPMTWQYVPSNPEESTIDPASIVDAFFSWMTAQSGTSNVVNGYRLAVRDGGGWAWFQTGRYLGSVWGIDEVDLPDPTLKQPFDLVVVAGPSSDDPFRAVFGGNLTLHTCAPNDFLGS